MVDRARIGKWVNARMAVPVVVERDDHDAREAAAVGDDYVIAAPDPATVWTGDAAIRGAGGRNARSDTTGGTREQEAAVVISFPTIELGGFVPHVNDRVRVVGGTDAALDGRTFCIDAIRGSGWRVRISCDAVEYQR